MFATLVLALLLTAAQVRSIVTPTSGGVVPHPSSLGYQGDPIQISPSVAIVAERSCDLLDAAILRAKTNIFSKGDPLKRDKIDDAGINKLTVRVSGLDCDGYPSVETDESYSLAVSSDGTGTLTANEVWGALHGLETFSQLTYTADLGKTFMIKPAVISDSPRFKHRGIMLDTSRHFLPLKYIKLNLQLMAQSKLNVFHWHVVDAQSFPFVSKTYPQLTKGAYTPNHIYTPDDVQETIEYARQRGIRVIPEFDTPGHVSSWGKGLPKLLTKCYDTKTGKPNGLLGPIDPTQMTTYDIILAFFTEVFRVFKDRYVHLGGDEVHYSCWESNPDVQKFVQQQGWTDYSEVQSYYTERLLGLIKRAGGSDAGYIVWEEVFTSKNKVRNDTIIHVWKHEDEWAPTMAAVTKAGLRGLLSSCWYLNCIHYGTDWSPYYKCDPHNFEGTDEQKNLVIGGETCMWGEFVDSTNVIARFCRGYQVEPINGPGFCAIEYD